MFGLKNKYKKAIKRKIDKHCSVNYQIINKDDIIMGNGLFNHRCQLNAIQQVKEGNFDEVYLCVCMNESDFPVVHFINKKDNKYIDNTLGYLYEKYDYYLIRKIDESEFLKTNDILLDTKNMLLNIYSNKLINKLLSIDGENLGI